MAIKPEVDRLDSVYCSKDCQLKSKAQSQNLLFSLEPYLPPELDGGVVAAQSTEQREKAQSAFAESVKSKSKSAPLLAARFVARQVALETAKMIPGQSTLVDLPKFVEKGEDYGLYDHLERLRFVETSVEESEIKMLRDVLAAALPGLETAVNDEQYALWKGKMLYNAFGICYGGGRDDKVRDFAQHTGHLFFTCITQLPSTDRPEDQERSRTPYGTSRQIGSGLFPVSSYVSLLKMNLAIYTDSSVSHSFATRVHPPPAHLSAMVPPSCTSSPLPHSKKATRSLSLMSTPPNTSMKRPKKPDGVVAWSLHADGSSNVNASGVWRSCRPRRLRQSWSWEWGGMNRRWRGRRKGLRAALRSLHNRILLMPHLDLIETVGPP